MRTRRLFRENVYLKEATAQITSVTERGGKTLVTLDQTIFFPTGGGQTCDLGTLAGFEVTDVYEHDDEIYHEVKCPTDTDSMGAAADELAAGGSENGALAIGDTITIKIDWERRFDNMRRHCGEHILSGIFYREYGGVNRGFHMGDQYMTIDISLEDDPSFTEITWDMAKKVELGANEVIWQNLPVITRHFDTKAEAEGLPLRKALAIDRDITIVCVGSIENPSDCVACCGTHPATAGQVGLIKLYKVETNKGMFRIYFEAGKRAFERYEKQFDTLTALENSLSAGADDLMEKYKSQQEKNREARTQLYLLKKEAIRREVSSLQALIQEAAAQGELPSRSYELLSLDDLATIARDISESIPKLLFLIHKPSNTVFLCSAGGIDCGKLVKENASIYGGKGGGNKTMARAIFAKDEYIPVFIDLIEKHLRP